MEIPDQTFWTGVGAILGWLIKHEAQIMSRPTRKEQAEIAAKVSADVHAQFKEIKDMLEKQNESSQLHRQLMGDSLAEIRTKVAVIRDRMGHDSLDETGAHRRRV